MLQVIIPALVALCCTSWIHPHFLRIAMEKNIVDNPDARKLQRVPVPILGGLSVVFGMLSGLMAFSMSGDFSPMFPVFAAIIIMMIVGFMDDVVSLTPKVRFAAQIVLSLYLIYDTGCQLNNFHGLWGLELIPPAVSVPLTVFSCVGIINAINLIDGVDGYSSGYGIASSLVFGVMFHMRGNVCMTAFAAVVAASLVPFFLHNVFGRRTKMFIGDAGTLSLGIVFSAFVVMLLSLPAREGAFTDSSCLVPFTLSVLCVPVFDTLRVMSARIIRGRSPFSPDKTHLHHLFIELGFSHIGTALSIIGLNLLTVLCWFAAYRCGLSTDVQLYVVIALGGLITFIMYPFVKGQIRKDTALYRLLRRMGARTHWQDTRFWATMQRWMDR